MTTFQIQTSSKQIIKGIPIGPSINKLYASVGGRQIKSKEGRIFDQRIEVFRLRHFRQLKQIHDEFAGKILNVDKYFIFHNKRLFCKDGSCKKFDVENFLKSTTDGLARLIGIDDRYFRCGVVEAISCENEDQQQLIVEISLHTPRTFDQFKKESESRPASFLPPL